jgi:hypothetical protein
MANIPSGLFQISALVHDQTEPQHPSKLGSTVEKMVEPIETAENESLRADRSNKQSRCIFVPP